MATNYFRADGWVKAANGQAIAGAQIYVCSPQPANVGTVPPSPLATIYSDPLGADPITQPIIADGFGHYDFYAPAMLYTLVIVNTGIEQVYYPDQSLGNIGTSGSGTALVLENNGTANGSQLLLNLVAGNGITVADDGVGDITISATSSGGGALKKWPGNWCGLQVSGIVTNSSTLTTGAQFGVNFVALSTNNTAPVAPTASQGVGIQLEPASGANGTGYLDQTANITTGILQDWFTKCLLGGTTDARYWIGMWDGNDAPTTDLSTNTPTANLIAFRYASATDSTIMAVCQTSSSSQTVVSTGVTPNLTVPQVFEIVPSGTSVLFYINGTLVATITTNIPASTVAMRSLMVWDDYNMVGSTNGFLNLYYFWMLLES